jgi:hypothetical protein
LGITFLAGQAARGNEQVQVNSPERLLSLPFLHGRHRRTVSDRSPHERGDMRVCRDQPHLRLGTAIVDPAYRFVYAAYDAGKMLNRIHMTRNFGAQPGSLFRLECRIIYILRLHNNELANRRIS